MIQVAPFLGIIAFGLLPELNLARLVALGAMSMAPRSSDSSRPPQPRIAGRAFHCGGMLLSAVRSLFIVAAVLFAHSGPPTSFAAAETTASHSLPAPQPQNTSRETSANPQSDALLQRAREFLNTGSFKEADQSVREYLNEHSNSAEGHFLLGYILFKEQKAQASLAEYTEGAKYHDPDASDLKIVALDYVLLGAYSDADRWLTRSIEANPKDSESWYYLGRTKYNENRFQEAIHAFEECLRLDPKNVKAQANLGLTLEGLGRAGDALSAYRKAIAMQDQGAPKNAEPFIDLGNLLLQQNQIEDAIENLIKAREISPQDSRVHESLGKAYLRLNKFAEAKAELEQAVALAPDSPAAHYMLGQVYRKTGATERAKAEFDRAVELNKTKSSDGMSTMGP